ncbi:hypothetical protein [Bradyrhizobium sp. F1.13.3]|uniref:hypothetical protein n=1 Tax=Bradyrhizobium sp. F1.13.3 TaxID=3156351 RepID=UPI0033981E4D
MTFEVRDFVNIMLDTAEDLAIFECGKPDNETLTRLEQLGVTLRGQLAPVVGADLAGQMVDVFCCSVMGEKHEREALAALGIL